MKIEEVIATLYKLRKDRDRAEGFEIEKHLGSAIEPEHLKNYALFGIALKIEDCRKELRGFIEDNADSNDSNRNEEVIQALIALKKGRRGVWGIGIWEQVESPETPEGKTFSADLNKVDLGNPEPPKKERKVVSGSVYCEICDDFHSLKKNMFSDVESWSIDERKDCPGGEGFWTAADIAMREFREERHMKKFRDRESKKDWKKLLEGNDK